MAAPARKAKESGDASAEAITRLCAYHRRGKGGGPFFLV